MKDLKHLIYFENLLENADNELVEQAKADGGIYCLCPACQAGASILAEKESLL